MNRTEFIDSLRTALAGKATNSLIEENVRFYQDYIDTQMKQGKSEEQVLAELGDPRLLAKTIIEANKHAEGGSEYGYDEQNAYEYDEQTQEKPKNAIEWYLTLPNWLRTIVTVLLVAVVVLVLATAVRVLFIPICIIVLISYMIKMFNGQGRY